MGRRDLTALNRRHVLTGLSVLAMSAILIPRHSAAAGNVRYFTQSGAGRNNGGDWQNAMRLSALPKALANAAAGGQFMLAADSQADSSVPIDKDQIPMRASGTSDLPIILDASGDTATGLTRAQFQSSKPWSIAAITAKKSTSAYIALIEGASHIEIVGFLVDGTSPDGLFKFRGAKERSTEFRDIRISRLDASNVGRVIETDRQAFLKDVVIEDCKAFGIVRGFARFHNLAQGTFRHLTLDANNQDGGGKNVCQLISISRGENLLFEDIVLKNARNVQYRKDGSLGYFQGDGIVCERGTKNVTIRRCHGSGMGDAAFDLKTTNVVMEDSGSDNCKFGARFWTESDNVMRRCAFRFPVKQGGHNGACVQASGTLAIEDTVLEAHGANAALALHRLKKGAPPHVRMKGGRITLQDGAPLARANDAAVLELQDVSVNGEMRSGRFDLDKNEVT